MRKRRILSLLLAVAVMATMLVAVPLTASAETVADLTEIPNSVPEIKADDFTASSTAIAANSLSENGYILAGGTALNIVDNVSATIEGIHYTNAFDVKQQITDNVTNNIKNRSFAFKPSDDCTIEIFGRYDTSKTNFRAFRVYSKNINGGGSYVGSEKKTDSNSQDYQYLKCSYKKGESNEPVYVGGDDGNTDAHIYAIKFTWGAIQEVPVSSISVDPEISVSVGETVSINVTFDPPNATNQSVTWEPAENEYFKIQGNSVTGLKKTDAPITVTATSVSESKQATTKITVTPEKVVKGDSGTVDDLQAATTSKIYDVLAKAQAVDAISGKAAYKKDMLYENGELFSAGTDGNQYTKEKSSQDIDGTVNDGNGENPEKGGILLKHGQDEFALKLASGSTVRLYVQGGGSTIRYGTIGTETGITDQNSNKVLAKTKDLANYATDLMAYTNTDKAEKVVYISATGDSFISQIQVIVPPEKGVADSGWYGEAENPNGVIRFLQIFDEETVEEMGIYIVDGADGGIVDTKKISTEDGATIEKLAEAGGFYADIYDISKTSDENTTFYAVPFVKLTGGTVIKAETIDAKVDWDRQVEYTPGN